MEYLDGRYGAIDIGTVTCRLLVADVLGGVVHDIDKEYAITNLGVGVDGSGCLSNAAMDRVVACVKNYREILQRYNTPVNPVRKLIAVATSAARDAHNGKDFTRRLAEIGVELTVIPGNREAQLTFNGAAGDFPGENLLVVDIGGGSTELIAGRFGESPLDSHSFNIGCRRMTERYLQSDPPRTSEIAEARQWVQAEMAPFFRSIADQGFTIARVVAVAGTATSIVSIHDKMVTYDSSRVHKAHVSTDELEAIGRRLLTEPLAKRRNTIGLDPQRADVIGAGVVILEEVLKLAGVSGYTASESDILKGLVLEAASKK